MTTGTINAQVNDRYIPTEADLMVTGQTCAYNKGRAGYMNETFVYIDRDDVPDTDVINLAGVFDFRSKFDTVIFKGMEDI